MKQWQRLYAQDGAFYYDGARQSDCEIIEALNAGERAKEELATMQRDEAQLVELWRSQAFFHEGQEGDECNRTPMQNAVHVLKQLKRQNSTLFSNEIELAKEEVERLKNEASSWDCVINGLRDALEFERAESKRRLELIGNIYQITGPIDGGSEIESAKQLRAEVERLRTELAACKPKVYWQEEADVGDNTKWQLFVNNEWRASMYQVLQGNKIVWATTYTPGTYETAEEAKAAVEEAMQQSRRA